MSQGEDIIPIQGTTSLKNLEHNLASVNIKVSKEDDQEIRKVISSISVSGDRYPAALMKTLNK